MEAKIVNTLRLISESTKKYFQHKPNINFKLLFGNWTSFHLCIFLDFFGTDFVSTCKSNTLNYMYKLQQHCTRKKNVTCLMDHFEKKSQASVKKSFESLSNSNFYLTNKRKFVFARSAFPASTINRHCCTLLVIAPVVRLAGSPLGVAHRDTIRPNAHALIQTDPRTIQCWT